MDSSSSLVGKIETAGGRREGTNSTTPQQQPMKWIPREKSRNATFVKRKRGLTKKVQELTILCGIDACLVCFAPADQTNNHNKNSSSSNKSDSGAAAAAPLLRKQHKHHHYHHHRHHPHQNQPQQRHGSFLDVWPSMAEVAEMVKRYRNLPREEQEKKKLDNSGFLHDRIARLSDELAQRRLHNSELDMQLLLCPSLELFLAMLSPAQLSQLLADIDCKLQAVQGRIQQLFHHHQQYLASCVQCVEEQQSHQRSLMNFSSWPPPPNLQHQQQQQLVHLASTPPLQINLFNPYPPAFACPFHPNCNCCSDDQHQSLLNELLAESQAYVDACSSREQQVQAQAQAPPHVDANEGRKI